jgi:hypothetical protein
MKELTDVLAAEGGSKAERIAARKVFLKKRSEIWKDIQEGRFPARGLPEQNWEEVLLLPQVHDEAIRVRERKGLPLH